MVDQHQNVASLIASKTCQPYSGSLKGSGSFVKLTPHNIIMSQFGKQ